MKVLATYIMRGRWQAMLATASLAVVSLLLIPLSWPVSFLSGAAIALVVLVQGAKEGALSVLGSTLLLAVVTSLVVGMPMMAVMYALMVWLPVWILATTLLLSRSLALAMNTGGLLGLVMILVVYSLIPEPATVWYQHLTDQVLPMMEQAGVVFNKGPGFEQQLREATRIMTGTTIAFSVLAVWLSLLIARSWQAVLYRPEGFRAEFGALRLGMYSSLLTLLVAGLAGLTDGLLSELALNTLIVLLMLFMFQGLAIGHYLVQHYQQSKAWLIGMYVLLVFTAPHGLMFFALMGWLDNGFDFRTRFARKNPSGQDDD